MTLMGELGTRPEYKLAADEAKRHLDDLERTRKERLAGLDRLQIARTGPVRHLATAVVLTAEGDVAAQLGRLGPRAGRRPATEEGAAGGGDRHRRTWWPKASHARTSSGSATRRSASTSAPTASSTRTTGAIEVRRIEVKGYTRGNDIQLTVNEWYKAQQLGPTYWLYVVWDPLEARPRTGPHPQPGGEARPRQEGNRRGQDVRSRSYCY